MNKDLKLLLIIIITAAIMFATSLLLDLKLIKAQIIRQIIIYALILIQAYIGFTVFKHTLKQTNGKNYQ